MTQRRDKPSQRTRSEIVHKLSARGRQVGTLIKMQSHPLYDAVVLRIGIISPKSRTVFGMVIINIVGDGRNGEVRRGWVRSPRALRQHEST